ncbi:MAG: hypothetical protein JO149_04865 [Gammaproteobacteria bacterium]|nr:hypothetical protein [Gammaproteobacteria bacterium]
MEPRNNHLSNAQVIINNGNLDEFKKLLAGKNTIHVPAHYTTADEHVLAHDITEKHFDLKKDGNALILMAAQANQIEILEYLLTECRLPVVPKVMEDYLLEYSARLNQYNEPLEPVYKTAFLIFKNALLFGLRNKNNNLIKKILKDVEGKFPAEEFGAIYNENFREYSRIHIFAYGDDALVEEMEPKFHFHDEKFLENMNKWFHKKPTQVVVDRDNLEDTYEDRDVHLSHFKKTIICETSSKLDVIKFEYDKLISESLAKIQTLNENTQAKKGNFFFTESRATMMNNLSTDLAGSCKSTKSPREKLRTMIIYLVDTYNVICEKVNDSFFQTKSTTANEIKSILQGICGNVGITLYDMDRDSKYKLRRINRDNLVGQLSVIENRMLEALYNPSVPSPVNKSNKR